MLLALAVILATAGCAGKAKPDRLVKLTRFRNDQLVDRTKLPICPLSESGSLAERERLNTCMRAIRNRGIAIARDDGSACLSASIVFAVTTTGIEGECTSYGTAPQAWVRKSECTSQPVHQYTLKLVLSDPENESPVLESYVVTEAGNTGFDAASVSALCEGAFFKYPKAMRGKLITSNEK